MLTQEDRDAINGLFDRLENVAHGKPAREPEAEALIAERLSTAPEAPYYMAQTILVQEHALAVAQERIAQLETEAKRRQSSGGFLGGLFGTADRETSHARHRGAVRPMSEQGGSFLAGAAQTALGVTGGVLLGSAIAGMFSADSATTAESGTPPEDGSTWGDAGGDVGGDDFGF